MNRIDTSIRRFKFTLSLICFVLIATSISSAQSMFYHTTDGKQIIYDLLTVHNMAFTDENFMVRNSNGITDAYPLSNFRKLNFKLETGLNPALIFIPNTFRVYPNPVQDMLNLSFYGEIKADATIRILNLEGKLMFTQLISDSGDIQINTSRFPAGIFLCQFTNGDTILSQKIVKQ